MFNLPQFKFERLSFWLGFLAATLLWWIFSKIRQQLPHLISVLKQRAAENKQKRLRSIEEVLCQETLQQVQKLHLSARFFSLDEILVEPRFIAPPPVQTPDSPAAPLDLITASVPYTPDWPELASALGLPTLNLVQVLENDVHIAVIGKPGSGKTTALAHLAANLCRRVISNSSASSPWVPIYVHAIDLDTTLPEKEKDRDPLLALIAAVSPQFSAALRSQLPGFLKAAGAEGKFVLLLDGLDEMAPASVQQVSAYLARLLSAYPNYRVVAAASSEYMDGLISMGFQPLALASWNRSQVLQFVETWGKLWNTHITPAAQKNSEEQIQELPSLLVTSWLTTEPIQLTPLEWTLRVWAVYAGDVIGPTALDGLRAYLKRLTANQIPMGALAALAYQMVQQEEAGRTYDAMEKFLSHAVRGKTPEPAAEQSAPLETAKGKLKEKVLSSGEKILNTLLDNGLLIEHRGEVLCFASPIFLAYFAAVGYREADPLPLTAPVWSLRASQLRYLAAENRANELLQALLEQDGRPFFFNLLRAASCLSDSPLNAPWRSALMRQIIQRIQDEGLPLSIRARLFSALVASNDPNSATLFRQLLSTPSSGLRQLCALGCGAVQDTRAVKELSALLQDSAEPVRHAACIALAALRSTAGLEAVAQALMQGDESLRQVAAESMAFNPAEGHAILKEGLEMDDLLLRRAVILGIAQVQEPWARALLEKTAIEDAQWVVRNIAAQALEYIQKPNPYIPRSLPVASEAAWLIKFASKQGSSLPADKPATEMLLQALRSGAPEEQLAALQYLKTVPEEGVISTLYQLAYGQSPLVTPSLNALWTLSLSGAALPSPIQYGVGY